MPNLLDIAIKQGYIPGGKPTTTPRVTPSTPAIPAVRPTPPPSQPTQKSTGSLLQQALSQGYQPVQRPKLNLMELSQRPPEEPSVGGEDKSFLRKVGDFFTSSEQGLGATYGEAIATQTNDFKGALESQAGVDDMNLKLAKRIRELDSQGNTEVANRLRERLKQNVGGVKAEEIAPSLNKTTKQIAGESLGVVADIASAGTYGKAVKGAQAGGLFSKAEMAANLAKEPIAKTAKQAFLKYGTQAAKESIPIGATYGASESLKQNESLGEVVKDTVLGGATSGILGFALGGLSRKGVNEATIEKNKQKAVQLYKEGLRATKEKYKEKADAVIPVLLAEKRKGTMASLLKKADEGIAFAEGEYQKLGELQGIVEIDGLLNMIDDEMKKMLRPDGTVLSNKKTQYTTLNELKNDILAFQAKSWIAGSDVRTRTIAQQKLRELAQDYGADLYETRKSQKTISDNKTLSQIKKVDSAIRNLLNTNNPKYAQINEVYHLNTTLKEIIEETAERESSGVMTRLNNWKNYVTTALGLTIGASTGSAKGWLAGIALPLTLTAMSEVANSTWWLTRKAVRKQEFISKLMTLSISEMNKVLRYVSANGERAFEEFLDED